MGRRIEEVNLPVYDLCKHPGHNEIYLFRVLVWPNPYGD